MVLLFALIQIGREELLPRLRVEVILEEFDKFLFGLFIIAEKLLPVQERSLVLGRGGLLRDLARLKRHVVRLPASSESEKANFVLLCQ